MSNENKIEEIIRTSLEKMRSMLDANTVIGTPYVTQNGVTIIPVSKISMGFASGGLDYFSKSSQKSGDDKSSQKTAIPGMQNFGGGGGSGLTVNPVGFLVINIDGKVEMINVGVQPPSDPIEQIAGIIERRPELIASIKDIFTKKSDAKAAMDDDK